MPSNITTTGSDGVSISRLRDAVSGRVITAEDADYDQARTVVSGNVDRRPALIVRVADADDVARVVLAAAETGLPLSVRSGGHSGAGHSVNDGGIVLDLSQMRALTIDADAGTAWAETGLTAGLYTAAAGEHGLATGFGDTGSVGIGGITLGGGVGYLSRKYGLTVDDVLAAEVVTADGKLRHVDAQSEPDLFWAIRGGGGNFGVVTRFHYRLHPVDTVLGGMLILPATPAVIAGFVAAAQAAPDELSTIANVMTAPPMPFLPAEVHGQPVVMAILVYAGDPAAGERVVAPLRALATPIVDMVKPMRYPEIYPPEEESYRPVAQSRTMFVDAVDEATAATIVESLRASTAMMSATQLRVLGGAIARVPVSATAYAHRQDPIMANVAAVYQDPAEADLHRAWVDALSAKLNPRHGAYVNFLGDEGPDRIRAAYPGATWDRLAEVKRRYDPENLFRLNQNIPPADPA